MANGIPPFLPASPPPMCKLDYYDDDDDDFGDFSDASKNYYQDNVSVTKSTGDEEVSNASQIYDPGPSYKTTDETSLRNDEFSSRGFVHEDIPVTLPIRNESNFKDTVCESDKIENSNQCNIRSDSTEKNEVICGPVMESSLNDSRISLNEDDSSVEDSTSNNFDNNVSENQTENELSFGNNPVMKNHIANDTVKLKSELPIEYDISIPDKSPAVEDDFSAFCCVSEPKETFINSMNSDKSEIKLETAFSEDSDDSDTPDIDFNCFITCPQDLINHQPNSNFADFENESCENDFGDFTKPSEVDFTISPVTSSMQFPENFDFKSVPCLEGESSTQINNNQSDNFSANPMDDDFDDFVSTSTSPTMESVEGMKTEQIGASDTSRSLNECDSDVNSSQITSNQTTADPVATTSSNQEEKMYVLGSEGWNEIFQVSGEKQIEVNLNTFEGKLNGSCVWCKIKDIEASPALSYNWNDSETQKVLLSALYVDSRNILFGPRWNSDVPRFASNLGFSPLVPEKASEKKDIQTVSVSPQTVLREDSIIDDNIPKPPTTVPDAHFDWNNSGLTNPLDNHSHSSLLDLDLLASFDIHSPYYKNNRKNDRTKGSGASTYENSLLAKTPSRKELSEEAKDILNNLPNLYVMEKQYIVFPVS